MDDAKRVANFVGFEFRRADNAQWPRPLSISIIFFLALRACFGTLSKYLRYRSSYLLACVISLYIAPVKS